jgi:hypothetical protein
MTQWDVLMQLMEERKEMIEELFVICHDLSARNQNLQLENFLLKQRINKKIRVRSK